MNIPQGFSFSTAQCGFKHSGRNDLGLILSHSDAIAAGVFTQNRFQAAPVLVAKDYLHASRKIRAIIANSGQANACTGEEGYAACLRTTEMTAAIAGCKKQQILPASTGVIGDQLKLDKWETGIAQLRENLGKKDPVDVAKAIMTTDKFPKLSTKTLATPAGAIHLLGMAKGAGMICPNMATMLGFILCDAQVAPDWWQQALSRAVALSFNSITVDGDTSTNDCVLALANGASSICIDSNSASQLEEVLTDLCQELAYLIVQDAEGGTKVLRIKVSGAKTNTDARLAAQAIGNSPLVKTALYGCDPNWGRIIAALGRSGSNFLPEEVVLKIAGSTIFEQGCPVAGDWDALLAPALRRSEIEISMSLGNGVGACTLLASDLTEEYIRLNATYRT